MDHQQVSDGRAKPLHPWYTRLYRLARLDYLKILRTNGAPAQVARGVGYGIFVELIFFPTLGLAFLLIYPLNKYLKGHLAASIAGFIFAKLFVWATIAPSIIVGKALMGSEKEFQFKSDTFGAVFNSLKSFYTEGQLWEFLLAWNLGATIFGVVLGAIGFFFSRAALKKYQTNRKERREEILREKEAA